LQHCNTAQAAQTHSAPASGVLRAVTALSQSPCAFADFVGLACRCNYGCTNLWVLGSTSLTFENFRTILGIWATLTTLPWECATRPLTRRRYTNLPTPFFSSADVTSTSLHRIRYVCHITVTKGCSPSDYRRSP